MIAKDLPPAKDVQDVLRMVHEHTIYECALPPLFLQAEAEGLIEWVYAGAGRDWLGLTDRGRDALGIVRRNYNMTLQKVLALPFVGLGWLLIAFGGALLYVGAMVREFGASIGGEKAEDPMVEPHMRKSRLYPH